MQYNDTCIEFELIVAVVNYGMAGKIIREAKEHGVTGDTVLLGKGTIKKPILELLELHETRKEIVLMIADKKIADSALATLNEKLRLYKPNHGIMYSIPVVRVLGTKSLACDNPNEFEGVENTMYQQVMVVVDKGKAELVIEAAKKAGARGGTIINGRGSGIHETAKVFNMEIEPEKEIVIIICDSSLTEGITISIRNELEIDKPGNGIIFIQNISQAYGLR